MSKISEYEPPFPNPHTLKTNLAISVNVLMYYCKPTFIQDDFIS